jgi:hypothetical protein
MRFDRLSVVIGRGDRSRVALDTGGRSHKAIARRSRKQYCVAAKVLSHHRPHHPLSMKPLSMKPLRTACCFLMALAGLRADVTHAQTCNTGATTLLVAGPLPDMPTTAAARLPWPDAPAAPENLSMQIVQEGSGTVLNQTGGAPGSVSLEFQPAAPGGAAAIALRMDMLRTPLAGDKAVHATWTSGGASKSTCMRLRLAAAAPTQVSHTWSVNGTAVTTLPTNGSLTPVDQVELRVTAENLWSDVTLQLDPRIMEHLVSSVGPGVLSRSSSGATASFRVTLKTPFQTPSARYAAFLKNQGWSDLVQFGPLVVRGPVPRFLPNPTPDAGNSGDYSVAAAIGAPTVTLQGENFGLPGEEAQLDVRVRAFDASGTQIDERTPLTKTLGSCATTGRQCLTLTIERPAVPASPRRYEVVLTAFEQTTPSPARIIAKADVFTLAGIEAVQTEKSVVFAGRPVTLRIPLPAASGTVTPTAVRINGSPITEWRGTVAGSVLTLENVRIPPLAADRDRVQSELTMEFPNGNTGTGSLTVVHVPVLDGPVRLYGGKPQTVTLSGRHLSDVTVGSGTVIDSVRATSAPRSITLTLSSRRTNNAQETLNVYRYNQEVTTLPVEVHERPVLENTVTIGSTTGLGCGGTAGQPLRRSTRVTIPVNGALCVWVAKDERVSPGVRDSLSVVVYYDGAVVGSPIPLAYEVVEGLRGTRIPLSGVPDGGAVTVQVTRADQLSTEAIGITSVRKRFGFLTTLTGAQIRPFTTEHGEAVDEAVLPQSLNNAFNVGVGFYLRPINDPHFALFLGYTTATRSFCANTERSATTTQPAFMLGATWRNLAIGVGKDVRASSIPDSCQAPAEGSTAQTRSDRGGFWLFIGPAIGLL